MLSELKILIYLATFIILVTLTLAYGPYILALLPWLFVGLSQTAVNDGFSNEPANTIEKGIYYRISARYFVDQIEPIDFDVVVACDYLKDSLSGDVIGQFPLLYAKKTKNNHAVLISVPDFCSKVSDLEIGQGGGVFDGSFLPFTIWFDSADNLEIGLGYTSIFAFENPSARLTFREAGVQYSSREEFEDWYHNRVNNVLAKRSTLPTIVSDDGWLIKEDDNLATDCYSVGFMQANDRARNIVRKFLPASGSDFWSKESIGQKKWGLLIEELSMTDAAQFKAFNLLEVPYRGGRHKLDWSWPSIVRSYSDLDSSILSNYLSFKHLPTEQYPVYYNDALAMAGDFSSETALIANVDFRPETKGFAACYARYPIGQEPNGSSFADAEREYFRDLRALKAIQLRINDQEQLRTSGVALVGTEIFHSDLSIGKFQSYKFYK